MDSISKKLILKTMKNFIEDNDDMFASLWIAHLYDFVSELTGISQDELEKYIEAKEV